MEVLHLSCAAPFLLIWLQKMCANNAAVCEYEGEWDVE